MDSTQGRMAAFVKLVEQYTPLEGVNETEVEGLYLYRGSMPERRKQMLYDPFIILGAQGCKSCYLDGQRYDYSAGNFMSVFLPMPMEVELLNASPEKPFLAAYIQVDLSKMATLALKIERIENALDRPKPPNASGIFSAPLRENLLDPTIRLLKTLGDPKDSAILGDSIVEEIYYRILCDEQGGSLVYLLEQRGQVQRIARAVEYIHQNVAETIFVDQLAGLVNMSSSGFYKNFKQVMHLSPLQYAKAIKLNKAQTLIAEGKSVSEAGYMVGYNSPAQFSREYKRQYGTAPSLHA